MRLNSTLLKSTVVAGLGGLLFGFDTAVISGATDALTRVFQLTPAGLGLTVSIALWGTVIGSLFAGYPGDRFGRRDSLRVMAVLYFLSAAGCFRLELADACLFAVPRRPRYRWLIRAWADVHCRDRAGQMAGAA